MLPVRMVGGARKVPDGEGMLQARGTSPLPRGSVDMRKCMAAMEVFRGQAALSPLQASTPRDSRSDVV